MSKPSVKTYVFVAKTWSVVFVIVAFIFMFFPHHLSRGLTSFGNAIGFSGTIYAPAYTLWHILTFSLMGTLAMLAAVSARFPEKKSYYSAIMVAKTISVLGFLKLAMTFGTVWLLCAGADAFVALSLVWAYPKFSSQMAAGFARHGKVHAPFYEVWFGKIDIAPDRAFWFRYTTLNGKRQEASTWAVLFKDGHIATGKNTWPLADLAPGNGIIIPSLDEQARYSGHPQVFHIGHNHLDTANATGSAGKVAWNLHFTDKGHRFDHVPPLVKKLGVAKSNYYDCFMDLRFSGEIKFDGETISLKDRTGMIGHISGKQSAHAWAWVHCNNFKGKESVIFEGLSAQILLGSKVSPPLTSLVLVVDGKQYAFSSLKLMLKTQSKFGDNKWEFEAQSSVAILKGIATASENIALVEYIDTDDSKLWCSNSKLANLKLELTNKKTGKTQTFVAEATAAFELVNRETPKGKIDLK